MTGEDAMPGTGEWHANGVDVFNERGQHMAVAVGASAKDIAADHNAAAQRDELKREHQATLAQIEDRLAALYLERDELKAGLEDIRDAWPQYTQAGKRARDALASLNPQASKEQ